LTEQQPEPVLDLSALASDLLGEQEVIPRARSFAKFVASLLPEAAVSVYTLASDGENNFWVSRAVVGDAVVQLISEVLPDFRVKRFIIGDDCKRVALRTGGRFGQRAGSVTGGDYRRGPTWVER